jgi:phage tail sheath gpL-like
MGTISTAVSLSQVSATMGWKIEGSLEGVDLGLMPIAIDIIAEVSTAKQGTVPDIIEFTDSKRVADLCGDDSPAYAISRILRPINGSGVGSIPTRILTVKEAAGATATVSTTTITGAATKNVTHYIKINNRTNLDGQVYAFSIVKGDLPVTIKIKMATAINTVYGCPVIGTVGSVGTETFIATTGWKGDSSAELEIEIDTNGDSAGLSYSVVKVAGAGLLSTGLSTALANRGERWSAFVINALGSSSTILDALEDYNGNPKDADGNYTPTDFKPFIAFTGERKIKYATESSEGVSKDGADDYTDGRKNENTNCVCVAPDTKYFSFEIPSVVLAKYAPIANSTPHIDPIGIVLDLEAGSSLGDFATSTKRDFIVKLGCSTVKKNDTQYEIVDLVTTSHPTNEPQTAVLFRYVRDIVIDFNYRYAYNLLEKIHVFGKTIVSDTDIQLGATNIISPNMWKAILINEFAPSMISNAIMVDREYFKSNVRVQIGQTNPNRFETQMGAKRSGVARINSTTIVTTFNFN